MAWGIPLFDFRGIMPAEMERAAGEMAAAEAGEYVWTSSDRQMLLAKLDQIEAQLQALQALQAQAATLGAAEAATEAQAEQIAQSAATEAQAAQAEAEQAAPPTLVIENPPVAKRERRPKRRRRFALPKLKRRR
jgi:hypothetical protein